MTELEQPSMTALRALFVQYETEQRRRSTQVGVLQQRVGQQAAQSENLRQRIEQFSEQLRYFSCQEVRDALA